MAHGDVRQRLIDAAIAEVAEHGWTATSMQRVRERAGVSNGTLFHHFPTRKELEAAVLTDALGHHQTVMRRVLARSRTARSGVRNVVRARRDWISANPRLAMVLLSSPSGELAERVDDETRRENTRFFDDVAGWLASHGWIGTPHLFVMLSLWLGPTNELSRHTMSRGGDAPSGSVLDVLADAAWNALAPHLGKEEP